VSDNAGNMADMFKGWILGLINGISPQMLTELINNDEIPSLVDYSLPPYLMGVRGIIIRYKDKIMENLNYESVLRYAILYRPDLARLLHTPKGKKWITAFLKQVRFIIENVHLEPEEIRHKFYKMIEEKRIARLNKLKQEQMAIKSEAEDKKLEPIEHSEQEYNQGTLQEPEMPDGLPQPELTEPYPQPIDQQEELFGRFEQIINEKNKGKREDSDYLSMDWIDV